MGAQAGFKGAVRWVVDVDGVVRAHREKGGVLVDQSFSKAFVNAWLGSQATIEILRSIKGIVSFSYVVGEDRSVESCLFPAASFHCFGEFLAVHAHLPGQQAVSLQLGFGVLRDGCLVIARQRVEWEALVFVEI